MDYLYSQNIPLKYRYAIHSGVLVFLWFCLIRQNFITYKYTQRCREIINELEEKLEFEGQSGRSSKLKNRQEEFRLLLSKKLQVP